MPQRPVVFCVLVVCEKTSSYAGAVHGDDPGVAGVCRGATSSTAGTRGAKRHDPASNQPTDEPSDVEGGVGSLVIPMIYNSMIFKANKECPSKSSWIL